MSHHHFIPITKPDLTEAEEKAVLETLRSGWVGQGPKVEALESALAQGDYHAVAVSSGTAALHLALAAMCLTPKDTVLVPAFSFVASANVVRLIGCQVQFVDVDLDTFNVSEQTLASALEQSSGKVAAFMPVHAFGRMAPISKCKDLLDQSVRLVEDAACAEGSLLNGAPPGDVSDAACFSLHPRKVLTCGEGGYVLSKRQDVIDAIRSQRNHGFDKEGNVSFPGYNFRLSDIHASVALAQWQRRNDLINRRVQLAQRYDEAFNNDASIITPLQNVPMDSGDVHTYQSYVIRLNDSITDLEKAKKWQQRLINEARQNAIEVRPAYADLTQYSCYQQAKDSCPNASRLAVSAVALPLFPGLNTSDQERVVDFIRTFFKKAP